MLITVHSLSIASALPKPSDGIQTLSLG